MAAFDAQNENTNAGSSLRNEAANYLSAIFGEGRTEVSVAGKKVDGLFTNHDLGSRETIVLEAKDYAGPLHRSDLVQIWTDYSTVLPAVAPAKLLVVTRRGLAAGAQDFVDNQAGLRHLTIWELEDQVLGLRPYVDALTSIFDEDGLSRFYVQSRAHQVLFSPDMVESESPATDLGARVQAWLKSPDKSPIAILGGYGAGKSSFARWLISSQATVALDDPASRRPILIRLGGLARYSNLEGILGSMFTSQHTVRGYNFRRFMDFNAKGRFLIVLDGFDEMKHAMSFSEFRAEIAEFNKLVVPGAKVVLLGRPSAFTTDAEHHYVLKGRVPSQEQWRKLTGWPEFTEYRLVDFTAAERDQFIAGFLAHQGHLLAQAGTAPKTGWVEARVKEVSELAATDPSVFGRPVHLKILAELAADPDQDFTRLRRSLTRWSLYDEFFHALARREAERPARVPIGEDARLEFLRELAFWLWRERGSATNFTAEAIPRSILDALPDGDAHEAEQKRREYLAGAFLERKPGDNFYFPHRSFAEFLVAARMLAHPPSPNEHTGYGALAAEGVLEFLTTPENAPRLQAWAQTLASAQGALRPAYLRLLIDAFGGPNQLVAAIAQTYWTLPIRLLGGLLQLDGQDVAVLRKPLMQARVPELALALQLLQPGGAVNVEQRTARNRVATLVTGVLLERVLMAIRPDSQAGGFTIEGEEGEQLRELAIAGISTLGNGRSGRAAHFNWPMLVAAARKTSSTYGVAIDWEPTLEGLDLAPFDLPLDQVLDTMTASFRPQAQTYMYRLSDLRSIVVVFRKRYGQSGSGPRGGVRRR